MRPPRWIVPLEHGPHIEGRPAVVVTIGEDLEVRVDDQRDPVGRKLGALTSLVACQLGQALQDAAKWSGQTRARREARSKR